MFLRRANLANNGATDPVAQKFCNIKRAALLSMSPNIITNKLLE